MFYNSIETNLRILDKCANHIRFKKDAGKKLWSYNLDVSNIWARKKGLHFALQQRKEVTNKHSDNQHEYSYNVGINQLIEEP